MAVHIIPNQAVVQNADGTAYLFAWADTEVDTDLQPSEMTIRYKA